MALTTAPAPGSPADAERIVADAERAILAERLAPVWDEIVAGRGHLCPVCRTDQGSALGLLLHQTATGHWRRPSG